MPRPRGLITPHFSWEEAACQCGCEIPTALIVEIEQTARWLEEVRTALGGVPMLTYSWYRCRLHNARIGGETNSQHLLGRAYDFVQRPRSAAAVQALIRPLALRQYPSDPLPLIRGVGRYPGFTHIDRRSQDTLPPAVREHLLAEGFAPEAFTRFALATWTHQDRPA